MKKQMRQATMLGVMAAVGVAALSIGCVAANAESMGMKKPGHRLLLKSAVENADYTEVTLPIFEGQRSGESVWFVVTESSDKADAEARGVHYSPKMANGKGTLAVQSVGMVNGKVQFLGSVDFSPERIVVPSETGFPPKEAKPGAIGEALYTPLIQLPNGIVLNAPQIKNNSGNHDRLIRIDLEKHVATFKMTDGFFEGRRVHYTSFNASDPAIAALEAANYTPNLKALPSKGANGPSSALTGLAPVVNGPTGKMNPQRQGLSSALMGEGDHEVQFVRASVGDVVRVAIGDERDAAGPDVDRLARPIGREDADLPRARQADVQLVGVQVPVQLTHTARS